MGLANWTVTIDWDGPDFMSKRATLLLYKQVTDKRILGRLIRNGRRGGYRKVPKKYFNLVY